jgi:hypothetical protein
MIAYMDTITKIRDLKVGDQITVETPNPLLDEGKILNTENGEIYADMVSTYWADTGVRRIRPDQIISLRRGQNYFKVSIQ